MNSEEPLFTSFSPPPVNSNSSTAKTSSTTPHHLRSSQTSLTTIVKAQISFLLSILSAENYARNVAEINSHLDQYGQDTHFHLLRRLLIDNQSRICNTGTRNSELLNNSLSYRLLIEKVIEAASDPALSATFCEALNSIDHSDSFKDLDLNSFLEHVGINPFEKVGLCISLLSANKKEIAEQAREIIKQNIDPLVEALGDQSVQANLSDKLQHHLIVHFEAERRNAQSDTSTNTSKSKIVSKPAFPLLNSNQTVSTADFSNTKMEESNDQSLAKIMHDLGYNCCNSVTTFRNVLNKLGVMSVESGEIIREDDVAQAIGMMARTHTNTEDGSAWNQGTDSQENKQTWDIEVFVSTLTELQPHLDWVKIIEKLDYPEFSIHDTKGLEIILSSFKKAVKDRQQFPLHIFLGHWKNTNGQFNFLRRIVQAPSEVFNINDYPVQKVLAMEDFATSNANLKSMSGMLTAHPWNSVELIETMIKMADTDLFEEVRQLFERAAKQSPEVMCLGLAQIQKPWNPLHQEIVNRLVSMFLAGHSSSTPILTRLWQVNSNLFIEGCLEMYKKDAMSISRILDIAQDLKILNPLLAVQPFSFSIDLAALASRREYLNLEKWLQDNINEFGDSFVHDCLEFLSQKIAMEVTRESNGSLQSVRLTSDVFTIFLRILSNSSMSSANSELFKEINNTSIRLLTSSSAEGNVPDQTFTPDVEEEANSYYERVYRQEIGIEDFIKLLQRFKHSEDHRETQIFSCMVHNLFDEYQFFPKYPQRELTITSVIFGSLIQYQLVIYEALGIALRYVLNALRSPADSKMFNFGVQALLQFQSRLPEWPQYCSHLMQITQLQQSHPEIVQYVRSTLALNANKSGSTTSTATSVKSSTTSNNFNIEQSTPKAANSSSSSDVNSNNKPSSEQNNKLIDRPAFTALNLDTLLAADKVDYEVPSEAVQDKILFNINNVAQSNLETKVSEMKDILKESHYRWFANYLVVKRASIEPNYHQLYLQFLESLESQSLCRHVLHETFANIKVLLNSEKTVQSSSERSLLKNLGSWLGGMTLAKNKPIKHKNIAFKELLVEGYDSNRLIVAIPFVCKVLEQASKSKVFKPPNPWLMAILKLLVELYQFADLKLNLKFEVEVLCKSLKIELKDIDPTTILKDRPQKELAANQTDKLAQEFDKWPATKLPPQPSQVPIPSTPTGHLSNSSLALIDEPVTNLGQYITINPNLPVFANQGLRKLVHMAIDRAIREIITPVVERSVTIAGISTRELIIKDFAMEPNEEKMRNSAHLMVQNLAGSLALVTCKEPLRISMATHLRNLLLQNGFSEQSISEQAILIVVADNLDLACTFIEKAAMEKAVPEIDDSLASSFSNRKKHRERTGQPYYDMSVYSGISRYMGNLPEPLRLKPNGLLPQQLRVYEDFSRIPRLSNQAAEIYNDRNVRPGMLRGQDFSIGHPYNPAEMPFDGPQVQIPITAHQSLEKFGQYLSELDKLINKSPHASWASLPSNHDIRLFVKEIPLLATQSFNRDEAALHFSQKVVQLLYKNDSNLSREVYVVLLEKLCEISYKVNKEVTAWLIYADDERKFIVPVVVALIKAGLINVNDQDTQLAKLIENGRPTVIDFTTKLIRECVLRDPPYAKRNDFVNSLDALTRLTQRGKTPEAVIQLLEDLRPRANREALSGKDIENMGLREKLTYFFADWVRVYQHSTSNEKVYATFIMQLQQQGVLKGEEISSMFFRVCTEMSVDHYLKQKATAQATPVIAYQAIDAFSKLIVLLVKYHSDPEGVNNNVAKITYLTKILSIIVLVLAQAHEQRRQQFNQKPFFRLFSSLLNDLNSYEQQLQPIYFQILTALSNNTFHTLQPLFFPGFTFAWLSLISHRLFMPKLLLAENQKGWPAFHKLLICLFKFLVPFLRNVEMIDTTRLLYKGTLRVLLVLLHDFPEFLCDYHFSFCDVIPPSCIQLRNLILSAFPRNMRLPDPFTPNLKVDLLPEISQSPRVLSDYASALVANDLKNDIDNYLKTRSPMSFPSDLKQKLLLDSNNQPEILSTGSKYNVPIINALVLYVGIQAISQLHNKSTQGTNPLTHSAPMDIFQQLLIDLDSEGRYLFLSAIANQLRYPNSHTHYFSCILLYLFAEGNQEVIKEQVTRVLLERLIVNRPHPWGLLITFIELIKNPRYNFWSHSFTRCAADIERLFDSVSRSINQV